MDVTFLALFALDAAAATLICGYLLGHIDTLDGAGTWAFDPLAVANIWGGPASVSCRALRRATARRSGLTQISLRG